VRSVLCTVTAKGPLLPIKQTIASYCRQTHPDRALALWTDKRNRPPIERFVESLPQAANISILEADKQTKKKGKIADDDLWCPMRPGDLSHPRRLEIQIYEASLTEQNHAWLPDVVVLVKDVAECVLIRSGPNLATPDDIGAETWIGKSTVGANCPRSVAATEVPSGLMARVVKVSTPEWRSQLLAASWTAEVIMENRKRIVENLEHLPLPRPYVLVARDARTGSPVYVPRV